MAAPTQPDPFAHLDRTVAVPAFFEKLAADTGVQPADDASAVRLLDIGNVVAATVDTYIRKQAAAATAVRSAAIKAAADVTFAGAGFAAPPARPDPGVLAAPGVRDAALAVLAAQADRAKKALDLGIGPTAPPKKDDDEDEDDKPKPPVAPAV